MAGDSDVQVAIKAVNQAQKALKDAARQFDDLEKSMKGVAEGSDKVTQATKKTSREVSGLSDIVKEVAGAWGVMELAQTGREMLDLGNSVNRTKDSLDALTGGAADEYIAAIRESTLGTMTSFEAASVATKLYGMGLAETAEEAAQLARTSAILGQAFSGLNAAEAADEIALLLANMSYQRLDSFGVSSAQVRAEVNRLKEAFPGMTTEAAFAQAAMEALTEKAETLSGVLEDQANSVEGLETAWREMKEEAASYLAEAAEPVLRNANTTLRVVPQLRDAIRDQHRQIALTADGYRDWKQQVTELHNELASLDKRVRFYMSFQQLWKGKGYYTELLREGEELNRQLLEMQRNQLLLRNSTEEVSEAMEEEVSEAEALAQAYVDGLISLEEYEAGKRELMTVSEQAAAKARDEAEALRELERAAKDAYRIQNAMTDLAMEMTGKIEEISRSYTTALSDEDRQAIGEGFLQFLKITNQELALTGEALDNYRLQMGLVTQEALEFKAFQEELNAAMQEGGITTEQAAQIWESYATGQVTSAGAAIEAARAENEINQRRQESIQLIRDLEEGNIVMGRAGVVAYTTTAAAAEDAERRATTAIENVQADAVTQFENIELAARESFEAMAAAAEEAVPGLQHVTQIVGVLESRWMRLKNNPHINLTASISTSGSLPGPYTGLGTVMPEMRAAGGPVTAGRAYVVGEKGPELFVPDRSGTIVPQNALASGGRQQPVIIHNTITLDGRVVGKQTLRYLADQGVDLGQMTGGVVRAA